MIINTVLQEILNVLEFDLNLSESNKKNKIHYQWKPDILFHEDLDEKLIEILRKDLRLYQRNIGETQSIALENDEYKGWPDHRRPDGKKLNYIKAVEVFEKKIELPEDPGVYKFFNDDFELLYVGKAKNLKNRVSSYFSKGETRKQKSLKKPNKLR